MKRMRTLAGAVLGLSLVLGACDADDGSSSGYSRGYPSDDASGQKPPTSATKSDASSSGGIDIAPSSRLSLALRGGLGPLIPGQTITKAMVTMEDLQLVATNSAAPLVRNSVTVDLVALQDDLQQIMDQQSVQAGEFTHMRFRLRSAWIQTLDDQDETHVFASPDVDLGQFSSVGRVGQLELTGIGSDGFVSVAVPQSGISVKGSASLALHFVLAQSLSSQSDDAWVLRPRVWVSDASLFSSLDLMYDAENSQDSELIVDGFQVMLFDAGLRPVCAAPLVRRSSTRLAAMFHYLEHFEGPFIAVLVPPERCTLDSVIAVSLDLKQAVRAEAHVRLSSVKQMSKVGDRVKLEVRANGQALLVERALTGEIVSQRRRPVGAIEQISTRTTPNEPLRPGEAPLPPERVPAIRGLPAPAAPTQGGGGGPQQEQPQPRDAGAPPTRADAGTTTTPPADASAPPPRDAGSARDASPPQRADAGSSRDAGTTHRDAGAHEEAGSTTEDGGAHEEDDAGAPSDAGSRRDGGRRRRD
jgi:hypothetical protein